MTVIVPTARVPPRPGPSRPSRSSCSCSSPPPARRTRRRRPSSCPTRRPARSRRRGAWMRTLPGPPWPTGEPTGAARGPSTARAPGTPARSRATAARSTTCSPPTSSTACPATSGSRGPTAPMRRLRLGGPADFDTPHFYDLGRGVDSSLDAAPSFTADGGTVYFHSARDANTGLHLDSPTLDILDLYVAPVSDGVPGVGVNLGPVVNSGALDGEPAIHPDGVTLYFGSNRSGSTHIWSTVRSGSTWSTPAMLPLAGQLRRHRQPAGLHRRRGHALLHLHARPARRLRHLPRAPRLAGGPVDGPGVVMWASSASRR